MLKRYNHRYIPAAIWTNMTYFYVPFLSSFTARTQLTFLFTTFTRADGNHLLHCYRSIIPWNITPTLPATTHIHSYYSLYYISSRGHQFFMLYIQRASTVCSSAQRTYFLFQYLFLYFLCFHQTETENNSVGKNRFCTRRQVIFSQYSRKQVLTVFLRQVSYRN